MTLALQNCLIKAVRMGNWEAMHMPGNTSMSIYPNGTDVWSSYSLGSDPGEQKNVAAQHPDILKKMVAAYAVYAKNVGVVIPRGQAYANSEMGMLPPITAKNVVSINLKQIPAITGVTTNTTASYHNQTAPHAPSPQT